MRRVKYLALTAVTAALVLLANISAASACGLFHYEPEVPEQLAKY
ncbi:MAG: cyclic lactone autoinducer peptide [Bacillota bacterium]